jgi:AraC-like DNA-binding protein
MNIALESILNDIYYLGALQGLILSAFLLKSKVNIITSRLLALLTFFWAVILVTFALQSNGLFVVYPHLLKTISHVELAVLPLFYLSVKYLLSRHQHFEKRDLAHFIPLLLNILLFSGFYFNSADEKIIVSRSSEGYYYIASVISNEMLTLQGIVYPILSLLILNNYNKNLRDYQSNIDVTVIKGMKLGNILIFIAWMIGAVEVHLAMFNRSFSYDLFLFVYLFLVVTIYILSYVTLRSPETFKLNVQQIEPHTIRRIYPHTQSIEPVAAVSMENQEEDMTAETPALDVLSQKLIHFMISDKPYLNPRLSLQELAEKLNMNRYQLSALINQKHKLNFYEFVNSYRVQEVKKLMLDPKYKNLKMVSLAYDAGFNSKASFNRIFKQLTHQTPSEFKEELMKDS